MKNKRNPLSKSVLSGYKTLIPYLYHYRFQYIAGFICLLIVDAAQVIIPLFLQQAIDTIIAGDFTAGAIIKPAAAMAGMMTIVSGGRFLWRYFIHGSARRIESEMRAALFGHFLTLSYDFFQKHKIGDLLSRSTNDLDAVRTSIGMGLVMLVDGTIMAVSILAIIFINDAHSAAFAIIPLPFITALILLFGNLVGKRFQKAQEAYSAMSGTVQETFAGIRVVKSFVKEWYFLRKFADTNDDYRAANMALVKLYGVFFPLIGFFSGLTSLILLATGGIRVIQGAMTPGQLTALFRYFQMLIWPLMGAGFMVNLIQRGAVSLGRINEVMHTRPLIASPAHPKRPEGAAPDAGVPFIEFRNLTFAYGENEEHKEYEGETQGSVKRQNVLENINLVIEQGTWLGILGRTGSGKTTLVETLVRMIEPPAGTVFVKGIDVRDWDLKALRRLFAVTPQDSYLFSDSIRRNIAYGLEDAEDGGAGKIEKAVSLSAIDKDLANFADGLDTIIGERGLTLSGGQKQRVSISRAVIKDSEVLILDDAFSAVDAETEQKILSRLLETRGETDSARSGRRSTVIIISHRVSTLCNADKVLALDKGRIAEYGTPAELITNNGCYAKTAALQQLERQDG
ncbi:MAG: ABC transporter ATP-binding protein/permease [Treponema sp.]|jgi:ATP-binding cassette subfamily B protein|nr:ABC transporter ATP-binding protein/permease [Treponema sp.]